MPELDKWNEVVKRECTYLPEPELNKLCDFLMDILVEEPNVLDLSYPITICGDIHGQYYDLNKLFEVAGDPKDTRYLFLGDFVDRGYYSLETLTRLFALKARYPNSFYLIRGNHESRQITQVYGFYDECQNKYGNINTWHKCCKVFDMLPIAAVIEEEVFCVHGGLSPDLPLIDQIEMINRASEIPHIGPFCDLMWSDPDDVTKWQRSPRGAGWLFGGDVLNEFLHLNDIKLLARAHQLVQEGIKYMFDEKLVTVWSAPNYCYRCGNEAAVLRLNDIADRKSVVFNAAEDATRTVPDRVITPYFL